MCDSWCRSIKLRASLCGALSVILAALVPSLVFARTVYGNPEMACAMMSATLSHVDLMEGTAPAAKTNAL